MILQHLPLFLLPLDLGERKEAFCLFVYLWTAAQGVCILNTITEPVTFCGKR